MKKLILSLALLPATALAQLNVFTCEPEWAALANAIGGEHVDVYSATAGEQDPHHVQARPGLISKVRKANLLICTGAGLEAGWVELLVNKAGNDKVFAGKAGHIMAADYVTMLDKDKPSKLHKAGNPHIQLSPQRLLSVAAVIQQRLARIDANNAENYADNFAAFESRWKSAMSKWQQQAKSLAGKRYLVTHDQWVYLFDWLGLKQLDTLEAGHGIAPSMRKLETLKTRIQSESVTGTIIAEHGHSKAPSWMRKNAGVKVILLPTTAASGASVEELFTLFDTIIDKLLKAQ